MNRFTITGQDFHAMFYQCFEGLHTPMYPSADCINVKYALVDLLTADNDDAIINTIKKIKSIMIKNPRPVIIDQLFEAVQAKQIKNGPMFLKMLNLTMEDPQLAAVKIMALQVIKLLQADFHKYDIKDSNTVYQCLSMPTFAPVGLPMVALTQSSIQSDQKIAGYFKSGGNSSAKLYQNDLIYKDQVAENLNLYSEQTIDAVDKTYPHAGNAVRNYRELMRDHVAAGGVIQRKLILVQNPVTKVAEFINSAVGKNDDPLGLITMTMHFLVYNEIINNRLQTKTEIQQFVINKFKEDPRFSHLPENTLNHFLESLEVFDEFLMMSGMQIETSDWDSTYINSSFEIQPKSIKENTDPFKDVDMFAENSLMLLDQAHPDCSQRLREIRSELVNEAKKGNLLMVIISLKKDPKSLMPYYQLEPYKMLTADDIYPICLTMQALVYDACTNGTIKKHEEIMEFIEKKCSDENDTRFMAYLTVFGHDRYAQIATSTYNRLKNSLNSVNTQASKTFSFLSLDS